MPVVGVMGSGTVKWDHLAEPLGRWLAENGYDLLTGAGQGTMLSVCRAFCSVVDRRGRTIGIVPTVSDGAVGYVPRPGYPNQYVDLPIITPLPRLEAGIAPGGISRNYVNILTSDVIVALPGGAGTLDELRLAARFAKKAICFGSPKDFRDTPEQIEITENLDIVCAFISQHTSSRV